jgi:hypothetical protein
MPRWRGTVKSAEAEKRALAAELSALTQSLETIAGETGG